VGSPNILPRVLANQMGAVPAKYEYADADQAELHAQYILTMRTRNSAWLHNLQMNNMGLAVFTTFRGFWNVQGVSVHSRLLVCRLKAVLYKSPFSSTF